MVTIYLPMISSSGILSLNIGGGDFGLPNCTAVTSEVDDMATMPIILTAEALKADTEMETKTGIR